MDLLLERVFSGPTMDVYGMMRVAEGFIMVEMDSMDLA
jgi:hypothetical protein